MDLSQPGRIDARAADRSLLARLRARGTPDDCLLTLQLDGEAFRLACKTGDRSVEVVLPRQEAGDLTGKPERRRNSDGTNVDWLEISDQAGNLRARLANVEVDVAGLPGPGSSARTGVSTVSFSLAAFVGSWWPWPARREFVRVRSGMFYEMGFEVKPWSVPDLSVGLPPEEDPR